ANMNESSFIEVDGIRFETLVPKRVLTLPKKNLIQKLSDLEKHLSNRWYLLSNNYAKPSTSHYWRSSS
ncbi:MAG: hypothetical protein J7524_17080, partial [Roseofilum sp. Belize BBD 4]